MQIDYMIVGQGLAGSLLAWELSRREQKVLLVDNGMENASQVAAGLINPVTGQRFAKTGHVDILLPVARHYYLGLEQFFKRSFFIEKSMLRLLRNEKERQNAERRLKESTYRHYLTQFSESIADIHSPQGILKQMQTGYLLTNPLLNSLRQFFSERNSYLRTAVDHADIQLEPKLRWQKWQPRRIIFCEGHQGRFNPWFSWLPFQPVKGEILSGIHSGQTIRHILNYGHWFIPLPEQHFKTGATFDREHLNLQPTPEAKSTLLRSLNEICPALSSARIINQQAGIRPATQDRQPFIGFHPRYPKLGIFNGFGAKGSLLIPFHCQQFAETLLRHAQLPGNIDIKRYYDTHFVT